MWQPKICLQPTFQRIISYLYDYKFSIIIYPVYELHSKKSNNKEAIKQLEYDSDGDENETKALKKSSTKKKNKKKESLYSIIMRRYIPPTLGTIAQFLVIANTHHSSSTIKIKNRFLAFLAL